MTLDPSTVEVPPPDAAAEEPLSPKAEAAVPQLNQALRAEYERLFETCQIREERLRAADGIVDKLVANRKRYAVLETMIGTPWYVPAVIHNMEAGLRFDCHLHNGDPLTGRTVHVPVGRPPTGKPPFTWEQSAQDALQGHHFHTWHDWSVAGVLYKLEEYNGWGYRQYHPEVKTPYLWSFSKHYTSGKYVADNKYDPKAVSQQCGAAVLLRRMTDRGLIPAWTDDGPFIRYSGATVLPKGKELQAFLNKFPGIELEEDGQLGLMTSDAFKRVCGYRLKGDPRG
jgi:lysozyme family protein